MRRRLHRDGGTVVAEVLAGEEEGTVGEAKIVGREALLRGGGDDEDRARTETEDGRYPLMAIHGSDNVILGGVGSWTLDPFEPKEHLTLDQDLVNQQNVVDFVVTLRALTTPPPVASIRAQKEPRKGSIHRRMRHPKAVVEDVVAP
ncbi:hypothetical protein OPV22_019025 [Ensete ventricosum]|uniref:Uncharacterized protein n=1 Tax=Ensete ventricosum TaxID=4639 RepID=A0AAV8R3A1_ENSVE|nr:hypothetical protein OPV22_019025 [Ensete ventricosum]